MRRLDVPNSFLENEAKRLSAKSRALVGRTMETNTKSIKELIEDRISHIRFKVELYETISKQTYSEYAKGFEAGRLHRLISERFFLEDVLLNKIKGR